MDKEQIAQSLATVQSQILGLEQTLKSLPVGDPLPAEFFITTIQSCASWCVTLADAVGKILLT